MARTHKRILIAVGHGFVLTVLMWWMLADQAAAQEDTSLTTLSVGASIILGIVEGLTEYLPISSTGHLLVSESLLDLGGTPESDLALDTYAICIQAGAIAAVMVLYRSRVGQMIDGVRGRDAEGKNLVLAIAAAFVPTVVIALLLQDTVRSQLFSAGPIAVAWIVGGVLILIIPARSGAIVQRFGIRLGSRELRDLTVVHAAWIGVAQSLALWPGVSRSLVTIAAATAAGLTLKAAVEFSFLLGLITLGAATAYEALSNGSNLIDTFGIVTPLIGLIVAFMSAIVAVKWMVKWLEERSFAVFGWYRIAAGAALIGLMIGDVV